MSLIPCPNKIGCDSDNPLTNFSSEDPDPRSFIGYSTGTAPYGGPGTGSGGVPPPLGSQWDNSVVTTFTISDTQDDADGGAGNDNVTKLADPDGDNGDGNGGWKTPPTFLRAPVFTNFAQSWTVDCPDGGSFTYTVPAGKFRSFSQAEADAAAISFACTKAQQNRICLNAIDGNVCIGVAFSQTIVADTVNIPVDFLITAGALPAWVDVEVGIDSVHLHGTPQPTDVGISSFTITAIDALGFSASRDYTISANECTGCTITSVSPLPAFDQGQSYTYSMTVSGTVGAVAFAVISGSLPAGLTMSSAGVISGTATLVNGNLDATFAVRCTDSAMNTCTKNFTLPVIDYHNFPPGKHFRIQGYVNGMFPVPPGPFGCNCFGTGAPIVVWDGAFNTGSGANFKSNQANGSGEVSMLTNTPNGVIVNLFVGPAEWGNHTWIITISCTGGGDWIWAAIKSGSNQGAKLDSPAGTYTLFSGGIGEPSVCSSTASVIIEEY